MLLITYVFSVAFMTFSRGTSLEKTVFASMGTSMLSLIMKGILPDQVRDPNRFVSNVSTTGIVRLHYATVYSFSFSGTFFNTVGIAQRCGSGCIFPRGCGRKLVDGSVGATLHPLRIFDSHEHVARIKLASQAVTRRGLGIRMTQGCLAFSLKPSTQCLPLSGNSWRWILPRKPCGNSSTKESCKATCYAFTFLIIFVTIVYAEGV